MTIKILKHFLIVRSVCDSKLSSKKKIGTPAFDFSISYGLACTLQNERNGSPWTHKLVFDIFVFYEII